MNSDDTFQKQPNKQKPNNSNNSGDGIAVFITIFMLVMLVANTSQHPNKKAQSAPDTVKTEQNDTIRPVDTATAVIDTNRIEHTVPSIFDTTLNVLKRFYENTK